MAELPEDVKMENAYMTHSLFIQNQLRYTSHSVEWLPIGSVSEENSKMNVHYFLLGTHMEQADAESAQNDDKKENGPDKLQLYKILIPNVPLQQSDLDELVPR